MMTRMFKAGLAIFLSSLMSLAAPLGVMAEEPGQNAVNQVVEEVSENTLIGEAEEIGVLEGQEELSDEVIEEVETAVEEVAEESQENVPSENAVETENAAEQASDTVITLESEEEEAKISAKSAYLRSGKCGAEGSDVSWAITREDDESLTLTISGTGEMRDESIPPWQSSYIKEEIKKAVIGEGELLPVK